MVIRKVKNASGNISVQIGNYSGKSFQLHKHIGSAKTPEELTALLNQAQSILTQDQISLFSDTTQRQVFVDMNKINPISYRRTFAFESLDYFFREIFTYDEELFKLLVFLRILNPTSKLKSIELMDEYFGKKFKKSLLHKKFLQFDKSRVKLDVIAFAHKNLGFDFTLVFYDVTTLYFETHESDGFRKNGFSKDNKMNQPQVLVGLIVDRNGFPIDFQIFEGNKFEGHTMLPIIKEFKRTNDVKNLTIVADAGMLSESNLAELEKEHIDFIVAGKTASTNIKDLQEISRSLNKIDKSVFIRPIVLEKEELATRRIIYQYSLKRAKKDEYDLKKNLKKAEWIITNPTKVFKKSKFVNSIGTKSLEINKSLVEKYELLHGIKSYVTNLMEHEPQLIIDRYHDLWKVEKAFRMSKSDLEARPIYHRKEESIKSHLLIVFASLAVAKLIEMRTGKSIAKYSEEIMKVLDFTLKDPVTELIFTFRLPPH